MQVNPTSLISQLMQGISAGERAGEKIEIAGQAAVNIDIIQAVVLNSAKLEQAMLQWFFAQRPELGSAMAKLAALQSRLGNSVSADSADISGQSAGINDLLGKMNNLLNSLIISPGKNTAEGSAIRGDSIQNLLALVQEFEQTMKEQSPAVQLKLDDIAAKLSVLVKQLRSGPAGAVAEKNAGESTRVEVAAKDAAVSVHATEELPVAPFKQTVHTPEGNRPSTAISDRNLTAQNTETPKPVEYMKAGEIQNTAPEIVGTPADSPSTVLVGGERVKEAGPQNSMFVNMQHTGEKMPGLLSNNAVDTWKKMTEILRQLGEFLDEHGSTAKLRSLLQDMTACVKALQVNPETEWENLLRYPLIYKQTLSKAVKLLQELSNIKFSDGIQRDVVSLMQEITANIHVQNAVNQLRQENPAQQTMYFQIPLQIGNDIKNGEMLVVHQREKQGQKWDTACSWYRFYLETQSLGPVQINLQAVKKQLSIQFIVTGTEQGELLERQKMQLSRILTHYGYEVADITCSVSAITPLFMLASDSAERQCIDITI